MKDAVLIIMSIVSFILVCVSVWMTVTSIKMRTWYDFAVGVLGTILNSLVLYISLICL
jgi:uncharacterized protein (DUF983 family)